MSFSSDAEEEKKRANFMVELRAQTKEDLEKEVYSPSQPLDFGTERKLRVYECGPKLSSLQWKRHLPKPPIALLTSFAGYKLVFAYTGFIWPFLTVCPLLVLAVFQKNLNENCETQIKQINLLKSGM